MKLFVPGILSLLWLIFTAQTTQAQELYAIFGKVTNKQQEPLPGTAVYIHETRQGTSTDVNGYFKIERVRPGTYHLHTSLIGYSSSARTVVVENQDLEVNITLSEAINKLHEIVVESDPMKQDRRENSIVVETVDQEYIQRNTGSTLMQSLEKMAGVSAINMGVGVSKPVLRGMSFNRVVVADNGVKQEGQQWGADHGLEVDQYNIEGVEILKGPASLAYGSDALGGVVNLKHPTSLQTGLHEGSLNLIYKSNNDTYGVTAGAKGNHEGLVYRVRLTGLSYGDYKVPASEFNYNRTILPIYNNRLKNTAGNEKHASATIGINRNWGYSHLTITNFNQEVGIFSGAVGIPRSYQLEPDGDRNIALPNQQVNHFKIISNNNIYLNKNWLEIDVGYQHNKRQEFSQPHAHGSTADPGNTLALQLDLHTISLNARYFARTLKHFDGIYGVQGQLQQNRGSGFEFLIPNYASSQIGIFAIEKFKLNGQWIFNGGLRLDYGKTDINESRYPFYAINPATSQYEFIDTVQRNPAIHRNFLNFSGALGASYNPTDFLSLKANIGKTFRIPAAPELAANGVHHGAFRFEQGQADLEPEQGYQFDIGLYYDRPRWQASVSPFFNYFQNFIYLSPTGTFPRVEIEGEIYPYPETGQLYQYKQTEALHTGGEITLQYLLHRNLKAGINGEYVWIQNLETALPLPFTPPASAQAELEYSRPQLGRLFKNAFTKVNYGIYAAQNRTERNEKATPGYQLLNFSAGFGLGKKKEWLRLTVQVQNVLNTRYYNHLSRYRILNIPEPGRNFVLSLQFLLNNKKE